LTLDRTPTKEKVSVDGNMVIEGNLTGNGNAQIGGALSAKDTNITGALSTSGNAVVGGTLTAQGAIINGTFNSSGNAQVGGTLTAKSTSIEGSLRSTGDATIGGIIAAQGIQCTGNIDAHEVIVNGVAAANVDMAPPVGSIISWLPGLYQNANQTGFNFKSIALPENWRLCDGDAVTDSPLLGTGYLPRLTDDRFLMGVHEIGDLGSQAGNNDGLTHTHNFTNPLVPGHKHGVGSLGTTIEGSHTHTWLYGTERDDSGTGSSKREFTLTSGSATGVMSTAGAHTHSITGVVGNTAGLNGDNSVQTINGSVNAVKENLTDANLPKYLAVYYIMRVK
jgi:cytoskeletal protein CcmA (bactofilin family)